MHKMHLLDRDAVDLSDIGQLLNVSDCITIQRYTQYNNAIMLNSHNANMQQCNETIQKYNCTTIKQYKIASLHHCCNTTIQKYTVAKL